LPVVGNLRPAEVAGSGPRPQAPSRSQWSQRFRAVERLEFRPFAAACLTRLQPAT